MKSERAIRRRLKQIENEMARQTEKCMVSGWHSAEGLFWDGRCVERRVLRYVLGMKHEPFNAADTMAGW